METKFQTSFIPKRPLVDQKINVTSHKGGVSIFMAISVLIFLVSIGGAGFTIVWKNVLLKSQEDYKVKLSESEKRFNISLIEELKAANTKIDLSKQLLKNHLDITEIFNIISRLTIEGVRFDSFDFSLPDGGATEGIKIAMHGVATSFSAIAFQSDVFGKSQKYGTNKAMKNPVLSDLLSNENGTVGFTFSTVINPMDISYEKVLNQTP